jgi:hypothetical protein
MRFSASLYISELPRNCLRIDRRESATTMNDAQTDKIKRTRGRPTTKKQKVSSCASYDGPSLDSIMQLSDKQIDEAFDELGVEATPFRWHVEDDQWNMSAYAGYPMGLGNEPELILSKINPNDKASMKSMKATAYEIHRNQLRYQLLSAYMDKWIVGLRDDALLDEVQRLSEKLSESEKRYTKRSELVQRLHWLVWPLLVNQSTKQSTEEGA